MVQFWSREESQFQLDIIVCVLVSQAKIFIPSTLNILPSVVSLSVSRVRAKQGYSNRAKEVLKGNYVLYVVRVEGDGTGSGNIKLADSKPCANCMKIIKNMGVKKVVYSVKGGIVVIKTCDIVASWLSSGTRKLMSYSTSSKI